MTGPELHRLSGLLARRLPLMVILAVVGALAGYGSVPAQGGYSSTAVLFVGTAGTTPDVFFSQLTQQGQASLAVTYAAMVASPSVAQAAVAETGAARTVSTVLAETKAAVVPLTSLIRVTVTDRDPHVAQSLANGVARAAVAHIAQLDPVATGPSGSATTAPLTVSQPAAFNGSRPPRKVMRFVVEGAVFGFAIGVALVLLFDYMTRRPVPDSLDPIRESPVPMGPPVSELERTPQLQTDR